jgi:hypothetical protein
MDDRLQVLLREYEMLHAENRLWLAASDPKLVVAFTACVGLAGLGVWKGLHLLFLIIPFVLLFLACILTVQLSNVVLIAAHLAVIEEEINSLIAPRPTLSYHSHTILKIADQPFCRDPVTGRRRLSVTLVGAVLAILLAMLVAAAAMWYALPKLSAQNLLAAHIYAWALGAFTLFFCFFFVQVARSKEFYMHVIRDNFPPGQSSRKIVG